MKIRELTKRTPNGYTFQVAFGPFWVRNWWYNTDRDQITPPSFYTGGKRYGFVTGFGVHFKRIRDVVKRMIELEYKSYNADDMLLAGDPARFKSHGETEPVYDEETTYLPPENEEGQ